jgi:hypothetical protein
MDLAPPTVSAKDNDDDNDSGDDLFSSAIGDSIGKKSEPATMVEADAAADNSAAGVTTTSGKEE